MSTMLIGGVVGTDYRVLFSLDSGLGELRTGLLASVFTVTIYNTLDTAKVIVSVSESVQAPGDYCFDIPGSFLTTHGAGNYKVQLVVSAALPQLNAVWGPLLRVSYTDIDLLQYQAAVWIDANHGTPGTVIGLNGTPTNPSDSLADALSIADATGLRALVVQDGNLVLTDALNEYSVELRAEASIGLNGQNVNGTTIEGGAIAGAMSGSLDCHHLTLEDVTGFAGHAIACALKGTIVLAGSVTFANCHSHVPGLGTPTISLAGQGQTLGLRQYSGGIKFENMTDASNVVTAEFVAGQAIIDSSCTAGTLVLRGILGRLTDNSAGTVVDADGVVLGTDTQHARKALLNRAEVDVTGQKLVTYDDDGSVLYEHPLETDGGEPVTTADGVQTKRKAPTVTP